MHVHDHITLRLLRLKPAEEFEINGEGLTFLFPKGGKGKVVAGLTTYPLVAGEVVVLPEHSGGKLSADSSSDLVYWAFSLCFEHLFPLFASNELSILQEVADNFKSTRSFPASSELAQQCHRLLADLPSTFDLEHRCQLLRIAASILQLEMNRLRQQRVGFIRIEDHLIQVFEKLSVSDILSLSVGDLAKRFGCSRRHLNRLFHQYFGFSVASLRMEIRLLKAVSLLRDPTVKVIHVAEQCGFNHLGLFNSSFKRRFGTSPGQWRKAPQPDQPRTSCLPEATPQCPLPPNGICPWSSKSQDNTPHPVCPTLSQRGDAPSRTAGKHWEATLSIGQKNNSNLRLVIKPEKAHLS